jgi:hypothetical protein
MKTLRFLPVTATASVAVSFLLAPCASADEADWHNWATGDRFGVELSAFQVSTTTDLKAEAQGYNGAGIWVNLEDFLGVDDSTTTESLAAFWRITERNKLRYSYFDLDRDGLESIDLQLGTIGGEGFGPSIETTFDVSAHSLAWTYSFMFDENHDFYAGFGLTFLEFDIALIDRNEWLDPLAEKVEAPVPGFVVGYDWVFSPNWIWRNNMGYLALDLNLGGDDVSGTSINLSSSVEWRPINHVSFTAGYQFDILDIEFHDSDIGAELQYTQYGPKVGVLFRF